MRYELDTVFTTTVKFLRMAVSLILGPVIQWRNSGIGRPVLKKKSRLFLIKQILHVGLRISYSDSVFALSLKFLVGLSSRPVQTAHFLLRNGNEMTYL